MTPSERIYLFGCPIDNLSRAETVDRIDRWIKERRPCQHVVVNVDKLLKVRKDPALYDIISACDIINADGMPLVWVSRWFGLPLKERVTGIDLMEDLVALAARREYSVFFLGARQPVVEAVAEIYRTRFPGLKIAGYRNGYWTPEEEAGLVRQISRSSADILFVAMGSPQKEIFLSRYRSQMDVPFVMGVGGSFDVVAGKTRRAPRWMQRWGLEWLFRFFQEPKRMWKRYLIGNTTFISLVIRECVGARIRKSRTP
ncbi:MAG TPA: WecB/TagA/CpsF family glycosyltransferase [Candidatus Omnitrophota bacterium]|nr:WecB/TagA/CpsF family glycosyltransferase [Candidatus Omnitrophota bacterium]HPB67997.1 WecB/TagA/CpsF family glycosyltransferase [Candidatus Omnitrophota bacterium]HQO58261.1 WecB/TagA/CpsF family glycosyltransferase [Candidatus Omnitrophota bacterium]HQP11138.1 WecB/TagA/CpsF family glycosyltransferase [Candidatus Omnitrophota bacterium]